MRLALRGGSGLLVVALAGGAVAGATYLGVADPVAVAAVEVEVAPTPVALQCAGPVVLPQRAQRGDAAFDPAPVAPVVTLDAVTSAAAGAGPLAVAPLGGGPAVDELGAGGGSVYVPAVGEPLLVRAQPQEVPPVVAATSMSAVSAGDARGLAAASCRAPGNDEWFVGGSTAVGATATLVLTNPGLTPAQVELELFGPNGPVEASTTQHVVAPGTSKTVDLGGAAADQAALVVHVTVTGGQVAAHVQDTAVRGFTPAGTDLVVPGTGPATRQVVTAVVAPASEVGAPDAPALRLLAPGEATTARVALLGPDGPVELPGAQEVVLAAGEVTDVPLGGLPAGPYTVVVDAGAPLVAGAVVSATGTPGELDDEPRVERAWSSATPVGEHGVVALPRRVRGAQVVVGAVGQDVDDQGEGVGTLRVLGRSGEVLAEHRVRVDAGTTGAWAVADLADEAAGVELEPTGGVPLAWGVALSVRQPDGNLVAVLDPVPVTGTSSALAVREDARSARG
ncbi:conserved hypothetical protein [Cellulomonas flavigena DSM 20109]|uniref:Large extracellular alpha-helical protein n=1 Tax=Cellulomonas flavigena (strain ATCC 482 / DSM 20109 / BCRC 11376 / JCM 18109 / NBRC 3775 / NCIMB 8073 / NRS 134) TaxID=446466 RepID=D5UHB4_CELFN|nr:DUF5719 family protein [Cellulomonas flavigena]ADG75235.1 conserved hypothetical protein [Cellulomonas flavigena DSM 20109]